MPYENYAEKGFLNRNTYAKMPKRDFDQKYFLGVIVHCTMCNRGAILIREKNPPFLGANPKGS